MSLKSSEFVILELEPVANVRAKGEQGDGDLGNHAGVVIFDVGVITTNINYCAEHKISPFTKTAPGNRGGNDMLETRD